jgi:diguanylate cyclase (GGDEF)-like protein/PAS domain S-box-containing protein
MYRVPISLIYSMSIWEKVSSRFPAGLQPLPPSDQGKDNLPDSLSVNELARVTLDAIADAVISTDASGHVYYMNSVAAELTGWTLQKARGLPLSEVFQIFDASTGKPLPDPARQAIAEKRAVKLAPDCVLVRLDQSEIHVEDSAAPILDDSGKIVGAVVIFRDARFSSSSVNKAFDLARHDPLTGLLNRIALHERFKLARSLAVRNHWKVGVLFMDVDRFKQINDSLGHAAGDKVLATIAQRLRDSLRDVDTLCRYGGDEFVALIAGLRQVDTAGKVSEKLKQAVAEPMHCSGREIRISVTIGASVFPDQGKDFGTLLQQADHEMLRLKQTSQR